MAWFVYFVVVLIRISGAGKHSRVAHFSRLLATPLLIGIVVTNTTFYSTPNSPLAWVVYGLVVAYVAECLVIGRQRTIRLTFLFHLFAFSLYSRALWLQLLSEVSWWLPIAVIAAGIIVVLLMLPLLDRILLPVLLMGLMLLQMLSVSTQLWMATPQTMQLMAVVASVSFIASGMCLAMKWVNKATQQRWYDIVGTAMYIGGQLLMVLSLVAFTM